MEKYIFKNYRTRRFSKKTFEDQGEYYIVADLFREDNPTKLLDVVPYWGSGEEVKVRYSEEHLTPLPKSFYDSFYGEFVDVSFEYPLIRRYTQDDAYRGICGLDKVNSYILNADGSLKKFYSVRVFCCINPVYIKFKKDPRFKNVTDFKISKYLPMWEPEYRAEHKKRFCYEELLT